MRDLLRELLIAFLTAAKLALGTAAVEKVRDPEPWIDRELK